MMKRDSEAACYLRCPQNVHSVPVTAQQAEILGKEFLLSCADLSAPASLKYATFAQCLIKAKLQTISGVCGYFLVRVSAADPGLRRRSPTEQGVESLRGKVEVEKSHCVEIADTQ